MPSTSCWTNSFLPLRTFAQVFNLGLTINTTTLHRLPQEAMHAFTALLLSHSLSIVVLFSESLCHLILQVT